MMASTRRMEIEVMRTDFRVQFEDKAKRIHWETVCERKKEIKDACKSSGQCEWLNETALQWDQVNLIKSRCGRESRAGS